MTSQQSSLNRQLSPDCEPGATGLARVCACDCGRDELLDRVIGAQEDERARVARDLHDEIGQDLTSVLLALRLVEGALAAPRPDSAEARHRVAEVRALVVDALGDVRQLAFDLRPTVLDDLGLAAALEGHAENFTRRHGIALQTAVDGLTDHPRLPSPVETVVYRVVQEALTNVARHAHAVHASLVVRRSGQRLRAVVEDDGVGFDAAAEGSRALGLRGMTERAAAVGGRVEVASQPRAGTSVKLEVPLA